MAKDTKNRLLDAALALFSRNGYAGTNIRELSASLGLGKSSLYRHFESKEEIWNALLEELTAYYEAGFGSPRKPPAIPASTDELEALTMQMLDFTVHDEKIIMTRKLLLTEQFRDDRIRRLATEHFNTGLESMFTGIFAGMMENGSLEKNDPGMLAFIYTASIASLVHYCDREPEMEPEIMQRLEAFVTHFIRTYGKLEQQQS
ncbi:MAG: TetR/AcrR family transcriptional regulator [Clostridia bacterium]|nr:TetR/AcrR family transcriptional regulator [Clostridia bacterium]